MFNPFEHLEPKRLALLESSWAHLFGKRYCTSFLLLEMTIEN
jgi:hypothetical protein